MSRRIAYVEYSLHGELEIPLEPDEDEDDAREYAGDDLFGCEPPGSDGYEIMSIYIDGDDD